MLKPLTYKSLKIVGINLLFCQSSLSRTPLSQYVRGFFRFNATIIVQKKIRVINMPKKFFLARRTRVYEQYQQYLSRVFYVETLNGPEAVFLVVCDPSMNEL